MNSEVKIFKALADKNRLRILKMLEIRPLCVCEIKSILDISTSTVSSHLSILKEAGFVGDRKDGKWVEYHHILSSDNPVAHQILAMIPGWLNDNETVKSDLEKALKADRAKLCSNS